MKKKSHILLGRYLNDTQAFEKPNYEKAFLFGCVEPDYNLLTYCKGALMGSLIRGHNFKKAQQHLRKTMVKLQNHRQLMILRYYRLGKLIHYVADAFTAAHNDAWSAVAHMDYEIALHSQLVKDIAESFAALQNGIGGPVMEYFIAKHQQYRAAWQSPHTDVQFIIEATGVVFRQLAPHLQFAPQVGLAQESFVTGA
ncbi:MAG TPA: zinc dependent phospholipase C family protein [Candidatus Acidoferrum sp.]|nr:zinc dependent phospholipase C family protein [Candidatus Acidoferrum sp.]